MDEAQKAAVLEEIVTLTTLPGPRPGDITVRDYVEALAAKGERISENAARNRLSRATTEGLLESEMVMHEGRRKRVYRKVGQGNGSTQCQK